jgi:hypothetical protein
MNTLPKIKSYIKLPNFSLKKRAVFFVFLIVLIVFLLLSLKSYVACGCGGCGGNDLKLGFTLNPKKIISDDEEIRNSGECKLMGCSICVKYFYFRFTE